MNIKCEPKPARSMPGLHATQRHLYQGAGAVDFVHGGKGQDLAWRFGVQQDGLLADGQGADEVFGDLDQEVFEGVGGVFVVLGWIGDDLYMIKLRYLTGATTSLLSNKWWQRYVG
ncbi:hypothetical protein [Pseudomonas mosselii]|uniref:hypothetical protein n=1 Tax=Pseudomonas mosselii TaxID=78327 RepID=UPI002DB617EC|nr:hypothetical protein [Pseudomonas mosselii]